MGERIAAARKHAGLTQEEVAERLGITQTHVSHIERGRNLPAPDVMRKLPRVLPVDPRELLALAGFMDPPRGDEPVTAPPDVAQVLKRMIQRGWPADFIARLEEVGMQFWLEPCPDNLPGEDGSAPKEDVGEDDPPDDEPGAR